MLHNLILFTSSSNVFSLSLILNSHCQTTNTLYPMPDNSTYVFLSRIILLDIFSFQNSVFVVGNADFLQFSCPCQKQPFTKITALYLGKTISGFSRQIFYVLSVSKSLRKKIFSYQNFRLCFFSRNF